MSAKRRWGVGILVVTVLGVGGYLWAQGRPSPGGVEPILAEMAYPVGRATLSRTIAATGNLDVVTEQVMAFGRSGRVAEVYVAEGDRVSAGTVLARLDDAQARLALRQAQREYELAKAEGTVAVIEERELALEAAQEEFDATVLTAPFDGIVVDLPIQVGDPIGNDTTALHLIDPGRYKVEVNVDESDLQHVARDQVVMTTFSALDGVSIPGRVARIGWLPEGAGDVVLYTVEVLLDGVEPGLRPGLTTHVEIVIEQAQDVLAVPIEAIVEAGPRSLVTRVTGEGERETVAIVTGVSDGRMVEVREGLSEGDRIVVNNYQLYQQLFDGQGGLTGGPGRGSQIRTFSTSGAGGAAAVRVAPAGRFGR